MLAPLMYTVPAMPELEPRKVQPRNRGEELTTEIVPPRLLMPRPGTVLLMNSHAGWSKERSVRGSGGLWGVVGGTALRCRERGAGEQHHIQSCVAETLTFYQNVLAGGFDA